MAVCAVGIAGMIAGSVADSNGVAITFGLLAGMAVLGLILVTAVAGPDAFEGSSAGLDEETAAELERRIGILVAQGADEDEVRRLVGVALAGRRGP